YRSLYSTSPPSLSSLFLVLLIPPPPRPPLFPYTTLFRSSMPALSMSRIASSVASSWACSSQGSSTRQISGARSRGTFEPSLSRRSEEHTSELQSHLNLVCRLLLEKKKTQQT